MKHNDPIGLLKAIEEHTHNHQETRCEVYVTLDAMKACLTAKQREIEGL